ncbi:MAG TPA: FkbM family methyltransferase [Gemmatales bacterium]|nr:FkbM family methyltransferase [Gemmatales bacterium]
MVERLPRLLRRWIRRIRDLPERFREYPLLKKTLGSRAAISLSWSAFRYPIGDYRDGHGPLGTVQLPGLLFPFHFRHGTSDVLAIKQLFVNLEYRRLQALDNVNVMIDAGANIGAAAVMLLTLFPKAQLIAIEPDPGNAQVLRMNLERYGIQALVIEAALWPTQERLELAPNRYRDKLDWSNQVQPASGSSSISTVTMAQILSDAGVRKIDLLKIDIEGAELPLFAGDTSWLKHVKNLCIEIHSETAIKCIEEAMSAYQFNKVVEGETTYYLQIEPR